MSAIARFPVPSLSDSHGDVYLVNKIPLTLRS